MKGEMQYTSIIERFFRLKEHGTTVATETRGGVTSFMAMAYIIFTNAAILSAGGVPFSGAVVATCAAAGLVTILMGLATNYPMCLAAGMGLNAIVAYTIVLGMGQTWQVAMGVVVLEGLVVLVLSATALRQAVMDAIPNSLKHAIACGIGVFITFIGLQEGGLIANNPVTLVTCGDFTHPVALLAIFGIAATGLLLALRVRGALLLGIVATALIGMLPIWHIPAGVGPASAVLAGAAKEAHWGALIPLPAKIFDLPRDWSTFFAFNLKGAITFNLLPIAFAFFMTDFFDTMGSAIGVGTKAGYLDASGRIPKIRPLLVVDSLGAVVGGAFGCSSNTCYIESTAGVAEGGRTGLTAVVCGIMFLLSMFLWPAIAVVGGGVGVTETIMAGSPPQLVPEVLVRHPVTAAALIVVGFLMMENITKIEWLKPEEGLPSFLVLVTIPLTYSITHGIGAGFILYVIWKAFSGRARDVKPFLWVVAALFVLVFALPAIERWLAHAPAAG